MGLESRAGQKVVQELVLFSLAQFKVNSPCRASFAVSRPGFFMSLIFFLSPFPHLVTAPPLREAVQCEMSVSWQLAPQQNRERAETLYQSHIYSCSDWHSNDFQCMVTFTRCFLSKHLIFYLELNLFPIKAILGIGKIFFIHASSSGGCGPARLAEPALSYHSSDGLPAM